MNLTECREKIDSIDSQIVSLYEERMDVCKEIAADKILNGKKVFDQEREKEKIEKVTSQAHNDFNRLGIAELFEQIMSMSRKLQYCLLNEKGVKGRIPFVEVDDIRKSPNRVVFQGIEGSYSQEAMFAFFGKDVKGFCVDTFKDAMSAIAEGAADYGVLPIENSSAGIVSENYDLLVEYENYIVGEQIIDINHCLLGLNEAREEDIKTVYSHPQALMQCAEYLDGHRKMEAISTNNTAMAARMIRDENDSTKAAIASINAAERYGLSVIKQGIQTSDGNSTRFMIVTNQKVYMKGADKVSICFEIPHRSGSLYHILSNFIYNNINMNKIESRPMKDRPWEYRFFIDFDGRLSDNGVRNALLGIREETTNMKILGNY